MSVPEGRGSSGGGGPGIEGIGGANSGSGNAPLVHASTALPDVLSSAAPATDPAIAVSANAPASDPESADGADGPASTVTQSASIAARERSPYPAPAGEPTQPGQLGIQFDFNHGARVSLPQSSQPWRVRLSDLDTGNVLFETVLGAGQVASSKRYYVRFGIEVWLKDEIVFRHDYSAKDREVLIQFPVGTLGDLMGWFPYAVKFKQQHGCKLTCAMGEKIIPLFQEAYPDITFVKHEEVKVDQFYATYSIGLFFGDKDLLFQPCDFRLVGLHRTAGYILGVDPAEEPPKIALADDSRPVDEPYVCIAVQSTTQCKYWNNPDGWRSIVKFLKHPGYRIICIDQKPTHGNGIVWNHIPNGAEDETGDRPLQERARWIKHAEFFVGLSSGLSWLAWALHKPVVMISGFTHPLNEFATPYRVINYHTCNSCWNDPQHRFEHKNFLWCPRHKDTPRQFECTRLITVDQVESAIRRIPEFREMEKRAALSSTQATVKATAARKPS